MNDKLPTPPNNVQKTHSIRGLKCACLSHRLFIKPVKKFGAHPPTPIRFARKTNQKNSETNTKIFTQQRTHT